ncbi:MAG: glutamate formimidoyltransferase [Candidatus Margulisbacteria bacterium]|nr:glutamate formimidoyltransferase [Candidatus Margulisiibacteriota bacterium]
MSKLVECVPNFSEGADLDLVEDIVSAVKTAEVLNVHSDLDHNRTVVTILGEPNQVKQAAFDLTERAMQLLDVNHHQGEHPFIGVVDVIPFVPLQGISEAEVVELAHGFGQQLWEKLQLPVYFYGDAAKIAERKELPYVRHGGYSALKSEINNDHRRPDIGQGLHVTAGAVAVGVRDFLIAYNVNLDTRNLNIAKSIAKNIREKSGGLPGIRALGVELKSKGITQVTINVTNHKMTSLKKVFDEVKKWAKEYGVGISGSEIVGLLPKEAVFEGMTEQLMLNAPPMVLPLSCPT